MEQAGDRPRSRAVSHLIRADKRLLFSVVFFFQSVLHSRLSLSACFLLFAVLSWTSPHRTKSFNESRTDSVNFREFINDFLRKNQAALEDHWISYLHIRTTILRLSAALNCNFFEPWDSYTACRSFF